MAKALRVTLLAAALVAVAVATPTDPLVVDAHKLPFSYLVCNDTWEAKGCRVVASVTEHDRVAAKGQYNASANDIGWDYVNIVADREMLETDRGAAYFYAGWLEGYLTMQAIKVAGLPAPVNVSSRVGGWIMEHIAYMTHQSQEKGTTNEFWRQVGALLRQLEGLAAGYNAHPDHGANATMEQMFLINFQDEYPDVQTHFEAMDGTAPPLKDMKPMPGHCSAVVKPTAHDLFMSHDSWAGFPYMAYRMFKVYDFQTKVTFSGHPAFTNSGDDWYMTSHELAIQETTNGVYNTTLFLAVLPHSVSEFLRVMTATFLAHGGEEWTRYFATENSGTYNNQYMVVDFKLYTPGNLTTDNTLWVAEQIPGYVERADVSWVLRTQGYWASYNIPYFKYIYDVSGNKEMYEQWGSFYSYTKYARPEIFRRNETDVKGVADVMRLMRYNDYQNDKYSIIPNCTGSKPEYNCSTLHSSMLSIASRGDLMPWYGSTAENIAHYGNNWFMMAQGCFGAVDSKIASWSHRKSLSAYAISGPTNDQQPTFEWNKGLCGAPPTGSPVRVDFPWVKFNIEAEQH